MCDSNIGGRLFPLSFSQFPAAVPTNRSRRAQALRRPRLAILPLAEMPAAGTLGVLGGRRVLNGTALGREPLACSLARETVLGGGGEGEAAPLEVPLASAAVAAIQGEADFIEHFILRGAIKQLTEPFGGKEKSPRRWRRCPGRVQGKKLGPKELPSSTGRMIVR